MNIKDWADYYHRHGVYVIPSSYKMDWNDWRNQSIADKTYESLNFESAKWLHGVAGVKGIKVISIAEPHISEDNVRAKLINMALAMLNLTNYPWVIITPKKLLIVVESDETLKDNEEENFVSLICQNDFELPVSDSNNALTRFYFNGIPTISPQHVYSEILKNSVKVLRDYIRIYL